MNMYKNLFWCTASKQDKNNLHNIKILKRESHKKKKKLYYTLHLYKLKKKSLNNSLHI